MEARTGCYACCCFFQISDHLDVGERAWRTSCYCLAQCSYKFSNYLAEEERTDCYAYCVVFSLVIILLSKLGLVVTLIVFSNHLTYDTWTGCYA